MRTLAEGGHDCFISYASADLARAEALHARLIAAGFSVWFDKARLRPGFDWYREIEAGCEASRIILPILTQRWKLSEWTQFETYGAGAAIPLFAESDPAQTMTPPLTRWQGQALDPLTADEAPWGTLFDHIRSELKKPVPDRSARIIDLPYPANAHFVGREKDLLVICETLHQAPSAVLTQGRIHALSALGGVGKTTLANEYARRFWRAYRQIFWVDARLGYGTGFARIFDHLFPHLAHIDIKPPDKAARALAALNSTEDRLLVIDNAEDEDSVQAWIPHAGHCRTLITSRFSAWSAGVSTLNLWVLDPEPARALLLSRAGRTAEGEEITACDALAEALGYLPLALEQAAAYIAAEGVAFTFAQALALYRRTARELLAAGALGSTHYPDPVLTTWTATVAKLSPESRAVLRMTACMAATPIPIEVFTESAQVVLDLAQSFGEVAPLAEGDGETRIRSAMRGLKRYSMVASDGAQLQVHNLVQAVEWETADITARQALTQATTDALAAVFPAGAPYEQWPMCATLAPHALITTSLTEDSMSQSLSGLLSNAASYLRRNASWNLAESLYRRALAIDEVSLDPDHLHIAISLNNLGALFSDTNRRPEAEPLYRRALAITESGLGTDHPDVAVYLGNLARLLSATNHRLEAETLYRRALAITKASSGPNHPDHARCLNNLAVLLSDTGMHLEAEPLYCHALAINEASLGPDHPNVATGLDNLAVLFKCTNRHLEAEPLCRRALAISETSLGLDHPDVAIRLNNLASLLCNTNRYLEAEPLYRRALAITEASLGSDHPDVARCLNNIAMLLSEIDFLQEAEPLYRRALTINETNLGADHPTVAINLINFAEFLRATNQNCEAETLHRRALMIRESGLGPDHPEVAESLHFLARILAGNNKRGGAKIHYRRSLKIFQSNFGRDHSSTRMVAEELENLLSFQSAL